MADQQIEKPGGSQPDNSATDEMTSARLFRSDSRMSAPDGPVGRVVISETLHLGNRNRWIDRARTCAAQTHLLSDIRQIPAILWPGSHL